MHSAEQYHELTSDNTAGMCPEVLAALEEANRGSVESYGADQWTNEIRKVVRQLFETDCEVFLVSNGTAANALVLAQLCQPFHSVVCHRKAHIQTDECGAPEFFTGGSKLLLIGGDNGKIDLNEAAGAFAELADVHAHKPRVISITQATELGTVYTREEIRAVAEFAQGRGMFLHMDGARFANAVAALSCSPKEISRENGVDVLCFGGTKNGAAGAELIIFFKKELSQEFAYRLKQGGQLASKARFLAAQWLGLLRGDIWLRNARHANAMAQRLAEQLRAAKIEISLPVEANGVFARLPAKMIAKLKARGWHFYKFLEPDVYRFMCSWATTEDEIARFASELFR